MAHKLLERFATMSHSETASTDGEQNLSHLINIIEFYQILKRSDEQEVAQPTQAQKNRAHQDNILGSHVLMGTVITASSRHTTRNLADRNGDHTIVTEDKSSKKRKESNEPSETKTKKIKIFDVDEMVENDKDTQKELASAVSIITSNNATAVDTKITFEKEKIKFLSAERMKEIDKKIAFKREVEEKKVAIETSKNKMEIKKMNINFLKEMTDDTYSKWKQEDDAEMKKILLDSFKKAHEMYMSALSNFAV